MNKNTTLCFTGHRPEKLSRGEKEIKKLLSDAIDKAIDEGYDTFISGLAAGVDIWAGLIVIQRKQTNPNLKLIAAMPFTNYHQDFPGFQEIMDNADSVYMTINHEMDEDDDEAYVDRDRWMVDNSSLVLAIYDGREGGTKKTIDYAIDNGIKVELL